VELLHHASYSFTSEQLLAQSYSQSIEPYWQQYAEPSSFKGVNQLNIHYLKLPAATPTNKLIVLSPGRTEGYLKYAELAYDLAQQRYDVLIIDHRGQGLSDRETARQQPGDVANFQYYVDDLAELINRHLAAHNYQDKYLLAHSMGGAIVARYLEQQPADFNAVALSAPMFGINLGAVPKPIAAGLSRTIHQLEQRFKRGPYYAPGQKDYRPSSFAANHLTHSQARYQQMLAVYQRHPQIQLGGPTNRWLTESFNAMQLCINNAHKITRPLLLLQAEQDQIVTAEGQRGFFQALNSSSAAASQFSIITGAKHEIMFERDAIRNLALSKVLDFFAQHTNEG